MTDENAALARRAERVRIAERLRRIAVEAVIAPSFLRLRIVSAAEYERVEEAAAALRAAADAIERVR